MVRLLSFVFLFIFATCCSAIWQPKASDRLTWVYNLHDGGNIDFNVAQQLDVVDSDLFDMTQVEIDELHSMGKIVICYISCGTWEDWRPDAANFPSSIIGLPVVGWAGEFWLDVTSPLIQAPLLQRFQLAQSKKCDAVDCDNVHGYSQKTGFSISASQQLNFNRWYADAIHNLSMAAGLKNDIDQTTDLVPYFEFAVNEQCHQYNECHKYSPFLAADKPIFGVEYYEKPSSFCTQSNSANMSFVKQKLDLATCPLYECLTTTQICSSNSAAQQLSTHLFSFLFFSFSFFFFFTMIN